MCRVRAPPKAEAVERAFTKIAHGAFILMKFGNETDGNFTDASAAVSSNRE